MLIEWSDISYIFTPSTFDWTYYHHYYQSLLLHNKSITIGNVGGTLEWKYCQNKLYDDLCMNPDPNNFSNIDIIMLNASNRPMTYLMYHDKRYNWWKEQLLSLGLTYDYAFSCVLNILIKPTYNVMETFTPYAIKLFNSQSYSIGIHIRLGDSEITGHSKLTMNEYKIIFNNIIKQRFDVAVNIIALNYTNINILFVSDSIQLRNMVRDYYNNNNKFTVIIPINEPKHIDVREHKLMKSIIRLRSNKDIQKQRQYAYLTTVGEWWLLSLTNVTILEGDESGFSRTAYAYSLNDGANSIGEMYMSPGASRLGHYGQGF